MDPEQIAELRRWARGLEGSGDTPELRAAARAILLLAEEVDRLRDALAGPARPAEPQEPDDSGPPPPAAEPEPERAPGTWRSLKASWSRWRSSPDAGA